MLMVQVVLSFLLLYVLTLAYGFDLLPNNIGGLKSRSVTLQVASRSRCALMSTTVMRGWPPDRLSEYMAKDSALVDYAKFAAQEKEWLSPMIEQIKQTDPRRLEKAERCAFLINAYNLWTIFWVIRERKWPWWKGHTSALAKARFFYWHRIATGAGGRNLYNFENKDIRPDVDDARVHFALNCASMSCPPLRRSLFTGEGLNAQLDEVTDAAVNNGALVQVTNGKTLRVNPIFKWYKEDFDKEGGALEFIRKHWKGSTPIETDASLDYFEYDWRVNSIDATWSGRALGGPAP